MLGTLIGLAVAAEVIDAVSDSREERKERRKRDKYRDLSNQVILNVDSSSFYQKNYQEVIRSLMGMGFSNITYQEIRQHNEGFFTKNIYGRVESVSINNETSFSEGDVFPRGAYIVVSFHVYKNSPIRNHKNIESIVRYVVL